jgi:predicted transcriptional regulator
MRNRRIQLAKIHRLETKLKEEQDNLIIYDELRRTKVPDKITEAHRYSQNMKDFILYLNANTKTTLREFALNHGDAKLIYSEYLGRTIIQYKSIQTQMHRYRMIKCLESKNLIERQVAWRNTLFYLTEKGKELAIILNFQMINPDWRKEYWEEYRKKYHQQLQTDWRKEYWDKYWKKKIEKENGGN